VSPSHSRIDERSLITSIPRAQAWAAAYRSSTQSASQPVLDLSQGVPRLPPHPLLLEALAKTSSDPSSARYGPILGEPSLRSALADEFNDLYHLSKGLTKEEIGITTGCNMAFLVLLMVLCPPGSKAMLALPAYFNQSMSCSLQSVTPVYIPSLPNEHFKPSIQGARKYLEKDVEKEIRMIALVTPSNPTGTVYSPEELVEWYNLAKEFKVALVLDETYRDFVGDGRESAPHNLFELDGWWETLISIGSMSSESLFFTIDITEE
jgi:aspartate/methionine/tyrosine aminotransferase